MSRLARVGRVGGAEGAVPGRAARGRLDPPGVPGAPDTTFRLLSGIEVEEGAFETGEVRGPDPDAAVAPLAEHPATREVDRWQGDEGRGAGALPDRGHGALPVPARDRGVAAVPGRVQDGAFEVEVTGDRERLRAVVSSTSLRTGS